MEFKHPILRWSIIVATMLLAIGIVGAMPMAERATQAAPLQQGLTCTWKNAGTASSQLWGGGSAYNGVGTTPKMYYYGGANQSNNVANDVNEFSMTGTNAAPATTSRTVSASARDLFGAACAFRDKGDTNESAVYCFGGTSNPKEPNGGKGESFLQRYLTKASTWEQTVTFDGSFQARYGAAAAYDPVHDVIWVTGGISNCSWLDSADLGNGCSANSMATGFLKFDDAMNTRTWQTISNPLSVYGHTMVYDSMGKRMIILGGSSNGKDGKNDLKQLNLSNADAAMATMSNFSAAGSAPSVFYHSAAYDPDNNIMVSYGGVTRNYLRSSESTENRTMVLTLGAAPAWQNITGATLQDRIGGAMQYDTKQKASIYTLGRKASGADPLAMVTIVRTTSALTCSVPPTATTAPPTNTKDPTTPDTPTPPRVTPPTPTPAVGKVCANITSKVPGAVINAALANPATVSGFGQLCNPNVPPSPLNVLRSWLTMQNNGLPYHPVFNGVVWSCGCP